MVSDKERREVARRLRELHPEDRCWFGIHGFDWFMFADSLFDAIGCNGSRNWTDYLADLIEPGEPKVRCVAEVKVDGERLEQLVHDAAVELTGIDRDALLALADEILENADLSRELHDEMLNKKRLDMALTFHEYACELREYAIRIRKALGVQDA